MWNNTNTSMQGEYMDTTTDSSSNDYSACSKMKAQNCVPIMIAQINRHGEHIKIYGVPVNMVTTLAIVTKIEATIHN